jgi:hypothetical protein
VSHSRHARPTATWSESERIGDRHLAGSISLQTHLLQYFAAAETAAIADHLEQSIALSPRRSWSKRHGLHEVRSRPPERRSYAPAAADQGDHTAAGRVSQSDRQAPAQSSAALFLFPAISPTRLAFLRRQRCTAIRRQTQASLARSRGIGGSRSSRREQPCSPFLSASSD